ncbi:MAG: hypothetical protein B1H08_06385 [Candidatus Omnitrophica bacterium 4484_171]|nr:MAG: hypothetical protein B1H08_06385 [Candidatus Omnitrophica bacterium 4484_171]
MEYLAFALKYRPQNFDEVIGQEHVVSPLKNAIIKKRVHHAYLFSGPRGVGKTSLARIFAKALNCERGPTVNPCGKCANCAGITKGTSLDVIEIDGASNRGIDDIRELREGVNLSPAHSRYKIYIIDEVHQITPDAFNALLKTLEEPPAHVKFIFATTHPQKVLPTILSRCQKFQFHLLPVEEITRKLSTIIKKENLDIGYGVLNSIAHAAGGSIRDAESLLDQIVPIVLEKKDIGDLMPFLGIVDESTLGAMADYIVRKDIHKALNFIQKFIEEGKDLGILMNSLIEHFRNILLCRVSPKTFKQLKDISPSAKDKIAVLANLISTADVLRVIDLFIYAKDLSKKLNSVRIPMELAVIKSISKGLDDAALSDRGPKESAKVSGHNVHIVNSGPKGFSDNIKGFYKEGLKDKRKQARPEDIKQTAAPSAVISDSDSFDDIDIEDIDFKERKDIAPKNTKAYVSAEDNHDSIPLTLDDISRKWPQIITEISKKRVSLASYLSEAKLYSFEGRMLKLAFSRERSFNKEIVEEVKNIKYIESYLDKYIGYNIGIKCFVTDKPGINKKEKEGSASPGGEEDSSIINELLDTFGGNIHTGNE